MKKGTSYSKKERRVITFGCLWRWGSSLIILLIPAIVFGICNLANTEPKLQSFAALLSMSITMLCVGIYDIIGTVLELKHVLVSLQLASRNPFKDVNPRREWTKSEKREYIGTGIIFVIVGLASLTVFTLAHFGIIN